MSGVVIAVVVFMTTIPIHRGNEELKAGKGPVEVSGWMVPFEGLLVDDLCTAVAYGESGIA